MNIDEQIQIAKYETDKLAKEIEIINRCNKIGYVQTAIETIAAAENCQRQIRRCLRGMRKTLSLTQRKLEHKKSGAVQFS